MLDSTRTRLGAIAVALVLGGCSGGGHASAPPAKAELRFIAPGADVVVVPGGDVAVVLAVRARDDGWTATLFADADGDLATAADRTVIAADLAARDEPYELRWSTAAVPPASYALIARARRADEEIDARALARVIVNHRPRVALAVDSAVAAAHVSRGGCVELTYTATDADDDAVTAVLADGDGDLRSTGDQTTLLAGLAETGPAGRSIAVPTAGAGEQAPQRLIAVTADGVHAPVSATAAESLTVANLAWANVIAAEPSTPAWDVAGFADGSTVVVGFFDGATSLQSHGRSFGLTSHGGVDAFIARYDLDGALLWAKAAGGPGSDSFTAVHACADGGVVVFGGFEGTLRFAGSPWTLTSRGGVDLLVAKYDALGRVVWARSAGGAGSEPIRGRIANGPDGSVTVFGSFAAQGLRFDTGVTIGSVGSTDAFVARFAPDGSLRWASGIGGTELDEGVAVAVGPDGSTVVAGMFQAVATFGGAASLTAINTTTDGFVARYDPDGVLLWARALHSTQDVAVADVVFAPDGRVLVVGTFAGSLQPGPRTVLSAVGQGDGFAACFGPAGDLRFAQRIGGAKQDAARGAATRPDGRFVVYGEFRESARFGSRTLPSNGFTDVYFAELELDGSFGEVFRSAGPAGAAFSGTDLGQGGVAAFPDGSVVAVGGFVGTVLFGPGDNHETVLTNAALGPVFFLARYNGDGRF